MASLRVLSSVRSSLLRVVTVGVALLLLASLAPPAQAAFPGANGAIYHYSSGDRALVAVAPDGTRTVLPGTSGLTRVAVSPDGRLVVAGGGESVVLLSPAGGETRQLYQLAGDDFGPSDIAWGPDGRTVVFLTTGGTVVVGDVDGGPTQRFVPGTPSNRVVDLAVSVDGTIYGLASFGVLWVIDPVSGAMTEVQAGEDPRLNSAMSGRGLDVSPDGGQLLLGCWEQVGTQPQRALCVFDTSMTLLHVIDPQSGRPPGFGAFSPDGTRIAFMQEGPDDQFLSTIGVDGQGLQVLGPGGFVDTDWAVQPASPPVPLEPPLPPPSEAALVAGGFDGDMSTAARADFDSPVRYAVAVSAARFVAAGASASGGRSVAAHAVLSRDDAFPDSLVGAALTGDGPLLFTQTSSLPAETATELSRILGSGGRVYLLGGTAAISAEVQTQLAADFDVVRLEGPSRVETSVRVAQEVLTLGGDDTTVVVARADGPADNPTAGWADSVSVGAYAAREAVPTVVTQTASVHPAVAAFLDAVAPDRTVLLGGTAALSPAVEAGVPAPVRVAGESRAGTAQAIATELVELDADDTRLVVINGFRPDGWLFGLPAGGLAADAGAAIVMVGDDVPPETAAVACGPVDLLLAGSQRQITQTVQDALQALPDC